MAHKKRAGASGDKKAARVLSLIAAAFIVTWTPYNVLVILQAFGLSVNSHVWTFFYWLCYLNSTLNPVCYGVANETFRSTFVSILTCGKSSSRYSRNLVPMSFRQNQSCIISSRGSRTAKDPASPVPNITVTSDYTSKTTTSFTAASL